MSTELEQVTGAENGGFSSFEVDAIGEILNISMGSAATAVSTLLDKKGAYNNSAGFGKKGFGD